jgi:hypothetical protein
MTGGGGFFFGVLVFGGGGGACASQIIAPPPFKLSDVDPLVPAANTSAGLIIITTTAAEIPRMWYPLFKHRKKLSGL